MIIVDTGAFLALFNQRDTYHLQAQIAFNSISEPLISTYPVVTETCYMLTQFASDTASFNHYLKFPEFLHLLENNQVRICFYQSIL